MTTLDAGETTGSAADLRWYTETDPKKRVDAIWECVTRIERAQEYQRLNDLLHASLYGNVQQWGFTPKSYGRPQARAHARLSLNVVRNMVGAVVSKIAAKNQVHPKFLTLEGNYSLQRRAKELEKLVGGVFYETKFYRTQRRIFRDIGIFGTGLVRPWLDEKRRCVTIDRVPKWDVLVDDEECHDGQPTSFFYRKWYDKRVLAGMFPGKLDVIERAGTRLTEGEMPMPQQGAPAQIVPVIEAFVRPSAPGADDGQRVVCVDAGELGAAEWPYDYHPFPKLVWTEEPEGFFGTGLAYELAGIQCEINDILDEFARAHRLIKGFWAVERNAKVSLKHINDDLGKIIQYAGLAPPTYYQPIAIPPDTYKYLWDLYAKAFEIAGISQLSASGMKPAGLNSGEAQRVYDDIQTERFLEVGKALEDWTLDVTEQVIDRARELAKTDGGLRVKAKGERGLRPIEFGDVDLEKDSYLIQVFPTSMLPNTPAGRLAFTNDLMNAKLVDDPGDALKLLGFPDTEAFLARKNAPRELLERNLERILEEGEWVSPEPLDDHDLALHIVPEAIAEARNKGAPAKNLSLARRYLVLSVRLAKLQASGQLDSAVVDADPGANPDMPPPGPAGPPPGGAPLPPPGAAPPPPPMPEAA